ncbi:flagellar basal body L-ring protein FlgH [Polynucleobacter paneuropaeus]|nr:flagellar basal body L-ring protein FlgH [Polynucleobacter paneuropaeus]
MIKQLKIIVIDRYKPIACILSLTLSACSGVTPGTITNNAGQQQRLPSKITAPAGSIYNSATYSPIFEGLKARRVGDTLTITVTESTSATNAIDDKNAKTGAAASTSTNSNGDKVQPTWTISNSNAAENNNSGSRAATFTGSISVTVNEVLPNGFLVVAGEKVIGFDQGSQFVRFSGVVNPAMITTDNSVASNTVADARIEFRTNNYMDASYISSAAVRFLYSIIPF